MQPVKLRWLLLAAALAAGAAVGLVKSGAGDRLESAARQASAAAGLTITEVWVRGRRQIERFALIRALAPAMGQPSLFVDIEAVAAAVRDVDGVLDVEVRVRFPGQLQVLLRERVVAAVWQTGGRHYTIDAGGHVIRRVPVGAHPELPLVVGDGANRMLANLAELFDARPGIVRHIDSAIWVSRRRWTFRTRRATTVHLPEHEPAAALARLSASLGDLPALPPEIWVVDLRVPDRMFVRMRPSHPVPNGREGV